MWELFGGSFRVVAADTNTDGRMEVFGLAEDDSVWRNMQNTPSVDDWTGWSPFGTRSGPRRIASARSNPGLRTLAVNRSYVGLMRAFGAARDGSAWINEQTWPYRHWQGWRRFGVVPNGLRESWLYRLWQGWRRFGVVPNGLREVVVPISDLSVGDLAFGLGVDDTVWIARQYDPYQPQRWRGWRQLGEGWELSTLVISRPDDLTIEAIGTAPDNTIWRNSADVTGELGDPTQWSGWQPFGAPGDQLRAVTALRSDGPDGSESEVFGVAPDDTIWRHAPGSNAWVQFGAPDARLSTITLNPGDNAAAYNLEVFGLAPDDTVWHAARLPSGDWGPLEPFGSGGDGFRQLAFARDGDRRMNAFGLAPDGTVWRRSQTTPGTWPPP